MEIAEKDRKERIVRDIEHHASMLLGDFAKRAFAEGYSIEDVREMFTQAVRQIDGNP